MLCCSLSLCECVGETSKLFEAQRLTSACRVDTSVFEGVADGFFREAAAFERVRERFAALAERSFDDAEEGLFVAHGDGRRLADAAGDDDAHDFRRGDEGARRNIQNNFRLGVVLDGDGKRAVRFRAGFGNHALGDFFLHHRHEVRDGQVLLEERHEDGRRDLVRQVRRDFERTWAHDLRDVDFQDVARHDAHVVVTSERLGEDGGELLVELDGRDVSAGFGEALRQRADAGTDLEDAVARVHVRRRDDAVDDPFVDEEILAELDRKSVV